MARDRIPTADQLQELLQLSRQVAVGMTLYSPAPDYPEVFDEMGIQQRPQPRHRYLGWTLTRPDGDSALFGFSYEDAKDPTPNEDFFHVDLHRPLVRPFPGKKWEKEDPRFKGTHHGPKDYFNL